MPHVGAIIADANAGAVSILCHFVGPRALTEAHAVEHLVAQDLRAQTGKESDVKRQSFVVDSERHSSTNGQLCFDCSHQILSNASNLGLGL